MPTLQALGVQEETMNHTSSTLAATIASYTGDAKLVVFLATRGSAERFVSSITWNTSENLSEVYGNQGRQGQYEGHFWELDNPTAGSFNLVVTYNNTVNRSATMAWVIDEVDITPGSAEGANHANYAAATNFTVDITSGNANSYGFVGVASAITGDPWTPGTDITESYDGDSGVAYFGGYNPDMGSTGTETLAATANASSEGQVLAIEVAMAGGGPADSPSDRLMRGVGT